jgi:O-antigen/teichoic acid export membrane protein
MIEVSLRSKLAISLAIQVAGSIATVVATTFVTRRYGPEAQGYLSYFRSAVELAVSIGLFGLPQAFVYLINSGRISVGRALRFTGNYFLVFTLIVACTGLLLYKLGIAQAQGFSSLAVLCAVAAAAGLLAHGLCRAIALTTSSTTIFNLVSILPSVLLLIFYLMVRPADYRILVLGSVFGSFLAVIAALSLFKKTDWLNDAPRASSRIGFAFRYGLWSFIPQVMLSLTTIGTYALIRQGIGGDAAVGQFSVAVLLISTAILPLNMVIPILFNAWSHRDAADMRQKSFTQLSHLGTLVSIMGMALGISFAGPATALIFGPDFTESVVVTQTMLAGIFAQYHSRLTSAFLLAVGKSHCVAIGSSVRAVAIFVLLAGVLGPSIKGAALAWTLSEFAVASYLAFTVIKSTGWPVLMILGLSPKWVSTNMAMLRTCRR